MDVLRVLPEFAPGGGQHVEQAPGIARFEATTGEAEPRRELLPGAVLGLRTELGEHVVHVALEVLVADVAAAVADQQPPVGQQVVLGEGEERRQHHPLGQVTRCPEQHEHGGCWLRAVGHGFLSERAAGTAGAPRCCCPAAPTPR